MSTDCIHWSKTRQGDGSLVCDLCGVIAEWGNHPGRPRPARLAHLAARAGAAVALTAVLSTGLVTASAPAAFAEPGDSVTTMDGPSYDYRYVPVDVDAPAGPWHHAHGHRIAHVTEGWDGVNVELRGHGTCTTRMSSDDTVMDERTDFCGAWSEGLPDFSDIATRGEG